MSTVGGHLSLACSLTLLPTLSESSPRSSPFIAITHALSLLDTDIISAFTSNILRSIINRTKVDALPPKPSGDYNTKRISMVDGRKSGILPDGGRMDIGLIIVKARWFPAIIIPLHAQDITALDGQKAKIQFWRWPVVPKVARCLVIEIAWGKILSPSWASPNMHWLLQIHDIH
ncbi:hypothetical protein B0H13DRAFT_1866772 [Mycena leptocephala]|nr:hypothetical protein B0H13DRAFT_1866772 [Mycena leptocephala]